MPIFINWFETEISAPVQRLLFRDFDSWEESHSVHEKLEIPSERYCRMGILVKNNGEEREIARTVLFGAIDSKPEGFQEIDVDLAKEWKTAARVIEFNLAAHFISRKMHVGFGSFGVSATQSAFRVEDIGLRVESGISFKSYYLHYKRQHGVTIDWRVKQFFELPLSGFPESAADVLLGVPVLLVPSDKSVPEEIANYSGRYLGVVTGLKSHEAEVLCRDAKKRWLAQDLLVPEAKTEVVAALASLSKEQRGTDSIQRRILMLSHALTQSGRRNVKVLHDKLRSAVDFLSPANKPFVTVDFVPFCVGRMRIATAPAVAQMQRKDYV